MSILDSQTQVPRANKAGSCCPDEPQVTGPALPGTSPCHSGGGLLKEVAPHHTCLHLCPPPPGSSWTSFLFSLRGDKEREPRAEPPRDVSYHPRGFISGHSLQRGLSKDLGVQGQVFLLLVCHRPAHGPTVRDHRSHPPHTSDRAPTSLYLPSTARTHSSQAWVAVNISKLTPYVCMYLVSDVRKQFTERPGLLEHILGCSDLEEFALCLRTSLPLDMP